MSEKVQIEYLDKIFYMVKNYRLVLWLETLDELFG